MSIARKAVRLFPLLLLLGSASAPAEVMIEVPSSDSPVQLQYRHLAEMSEDAQNAYFRGLLEMAEIMYGRRCVTAYRQEVVANVLRGIEERLTSDPTAKLETPGIETVITLKEICHGR